MIVKQPNGLYARISTVVDAPTDDNMTREMLRKLLIRNGSLTMGTIDEYLDRYLKPFDFGLEYITEYGMSEKEKANLIEQVSTPIDPETIVEPTKVDLIVKSLEEAIEQVYTNPTLAKLSIAEAILEIYREYDNV